MTSQALLVWVRMLEQLSPLMVWGLKISHSLLPESPDHPQLTVLSLEAVGWDWTSLKNNKSICFAPQQARLCT